MKPVEQAKAFLQAAQEYGFDVLVGGTIVTITKRFTPGDNRGFRECDMIYSNVFSCVPARGGSEWGTDGGSIGGAIALQNGVFKMHKSGVNKSFTNALRKLVDLEVKATAERLKV